MVLPLQAWAEARTRGVILAISQPSGNVHRQIILQCLHCQGCRLSAVRATSAFGLGNPGGGNDGSACKVLVNGTVAEAVPTDLDLPAGER